MNKDIKKIMITLALYALSGGMFYNFLELWMYDNNMTMTTVGTVLSLGALITVSVIFLCSNIISPKKIKPFACSLLVLKIIIFISLFFLHQSNLNILIKFLIMIDYAADVEVFACIYPLISHINKSDKLYAIRGLIYDISYYLGVLIASILLGKMINQYLINYNSYVIIAALLLIISYIILFTVDMDKYITKDDSNGSNDILIRLLMKVSKDKISIYYLLFVFFNSIGYYTIMALVLSIMINTFALDPALASNIKLGIGIFAVLLAALIMAKLTLKNNYINIGIKFLIRVILYCVTVIWFNKWTVALAFLWTMICSSSYTHVTDAPYINRFNNEEQLAFSNLKEMAGYFSRSIGTFLCSFCLAINLKLNFLISAIVVLVGVFFAYLALNNLNKEGKKNDR